VVTRLGRKAATGKINVRLKLAVELTARFDLNVMVTK